MICICRSGYFPLSGSPQLRAAVRSAWIGHVGFRRRRRGVSGCREPLVSTPPAHCLLQRLRLQQSQASAVHAGDCPADRGQVCLQTLQSRPAMVRNCCLYFAVSRHNRDYYQHSSIGNFLFFSFSAWRCWLARIWRGICDFSLTDFDILARFAVGEEFMFCHLLKFSVIPTGTRTPTDNNRSLSCELWCMCVTSLKLCEAVGEGNFGVVYRAQLQQNDRQLTAAVKMLRGRCSVS